jgi:malonyl-CoA/methylmalonyl-CoA synthetase
MAIIDEIGKRPGAVALTDPSGSVTFERLLRDAGVVAAALATAHRSGEPGPVAILAEPSIDFVRALLGIWVAGRVAVPLHHRHPAPELRSALDLAGVSAILHDSLSRARAVELTTDQRRPLAIEAGDRTAVSAAPAPQQGPALMLFTSGSTGRPKGVLHTHESLDAQMGSLIEAWRWTADDRIHLVLPLHHVHGLVNVVDCALRAGARCDIAPSFIATECWERLASGGLTLFMAVPTIYAKLIEVFDAADVTTRRRWSEGARRLRLMVSGSAALPIQTLERWEQITGHVLLERYGMTETGMLLSNRLERRVPGLVGFPLPGVEVRVVDEAGAPVAPPGSGELQVRSAGLFREYWNDPTATALAFADGWFRTGDVVKLERDGYRILGRASVDIIKTGGEKISALEIEDVLRTHEGIADCAVVGIPDRVWGERVCAAVTPAPPGAPTLDELRTWGKQRLATSKVPVELLVLDELPRNALGKVVKPRVVELFTPSS